MGILERGQSLNGVTETIDAKALTRGQVSRRASLAKPKSLVYVLYSRGDRVR